MEELERVTEAPLRDTLQYVRAPSRAMLREGVWPLTGNYNAADPMGRPRAIGPSVDHRQSVDQPVTGGTMAMGRVEYRAT
jgi:hypothetical protein